MVKSCQEFNIPCVVDKSSQFEYSKTDASDLVKKISDLKGIEGFVLRFDDGRMYKLKTKWYLNLHKNMSTNLSELEIWKIFLSDFADDFKALILSERERNTADLFAEELFTNLRKYISEIYRSITTFMRQFAQVS